MMNHNLEEGRKRNREEGSTEEEDRRQPRPALARPSGLSILPARHGPDPASAHAAAVHEMMHEARMQRFAGRLGQSYSVHGLPAVSFPPILQRPSALAAQQEYASLLLAQRANMLPGSLHPGYLNNNYAALSLQRQQMQLSAAQNPLLLQLLHQGAAGPAAIHQQRLLNSLIAGGYPRRPDPPTGAEDFSGNPRAMDTSANSQEAASPDVRSTAARKRPAAFTQGGLPQPPRNAAQDSTLSGAAAAGNLAPVFQSPTPRRNSERIKLLYVASDLDSVNAYQCYARKQIELFEATKEEVDAGAQGRNKPIVLGQVGIRCVHCSELHPRFRARAAVYYPSRLAVLYQAAQNIVNLHLPELCESIPEDVRQKLLHLNTKRSAVGGGKIYWSDTAAVQGVIDTERGLRYSDNPLPPTA